MSDINCIPMPNKNFKTGLSDFVPEGNLKDCSCSNHSKTRS